MKTIGVAVLNNKIHLVSSRFLSVDESPATPETIRLAIDEAINHLDALYSALASFPESDSIVEQDRLIDAYLAVKGKLPKTVEEFDAMSHTGIA